MLLLNVETLATKYMLINIKGQKPLVCILIWENSDLTSCFDDLKTLVHQKMKPQQHGASVGGVSLYFFTTLCRYLAD